MDKFFTDLWESIFTPGPTPSLLVATNASFACLQLVLLVLLVATYSVHFIILSFLCGGLWAAINWFVTELKASQEREEQEKARQPREPGGVGPTEESDTEVETATGDKKTEPSSASGSKVLEAPQGQQGELKLRIERTSGMASSVSTEDEWEKVSEDENAKEK